MVSGEGVVPVKLFSGIFENLFQTKDHRTIGQHEPVKWGFCGTNLVDWFCASLDVRLAIWQISWYIRATMARSVHCLNAFIKYLISVAAPSNWFEGRSFAVQWQLHQNYVQSWLIWSVATKWYQLSDSVWKWCGIHCGSKVEVITLTSFHSPAVSSIIGDLKSCGNQCCKYLWCGKRNIILKYYPYRKCLLILFHHLKSKHYLRSCRIAEFSNSGASWWL